MMEKVKKMQVAPVECYPSDRTVDQISSMAVSMLVQRQIRKVASLESQLNRAKDDLHVFEDVLDELTRRLR